MQARTVSSRATPLQGRAVQRQTWEVSIDFLYSRRFRQTHCFVVNGAQRRDRAAALVARLQQLGHRAEEMTGLVERARAKLDREALRGDDIVLREVRRAVDTVVVETDSDVAPVSSASAPVPRMRSRYSSERRLTTSPSSRRCLKPERVRTGRLCHGLRRPGRARPTAVQTCGRQFRLHTFRESPFRLRMGSRPESKRKDEVSASAKGMLASHLVRRRARTP